MWLNHVDTRATGWWRISDVDAKNWKEFPSLPLYLNYHWDRSRTSFWARNHDMKVIIGCLECNHCDPWPNAENISHSAATVQSKFWFELLLKGIQWRLRVMKEVRGVCAFFKMLGMELNKRCHVWIFDTELFQSLNEINLLQDCLEKKKYCNMEIMLLSYF